MKQLVIFLVCHTAVADAQHTGFKKLDPRELQQLVESGFDRDEIIEFAIALGGVRSIHRAGYFPTKGHDIIVGNSLRAGPSYNREDVIFPARLGVPFSRPQPVCKGALQRCVRQGVVGRLREVIDGDTFDLTDIFGRVVRVHMRCDAPELKQPFGQEAKYELERILQQCESLYVRRCIPVNVDDLSGDCDVAVSGDVFVGKFPVPSAIKENYKAQRYGEVSVELVQRGFAQWSQHSKIHPALAIQQKAQSKRLGMWSQSTVVPGWIWRQENGIREHIEPTDASNFDLYPKVNQTWYASGSQPTSLNSARKAVKGKVDVVSGDTLDIVSDGQKIRVRIRGIDAPELDQPFGERSKSRLRDLVGTKTVVAKFVNPSDTSSTRLADVFFVDAVNGPKDLAMVSLISGNAWAISLDAMNHRLATDGFWKYDLQRSESVLGKTKWVIIQNEARSKKFGMWSGIPVAPWDWKAKSELQSKRTGHLIHYPVVGPFGNDTQKEIRFTALARHALNRHGVKSATVQFYRGKIGPSRMIYQTKVALPGV